MKAFSDFVFSTQFDTIPDPVKATIKRSVLDTIGVALAGSTTEICRITSTYAKKHWCASATGPSARLVFDGTPVSPEGAAFAGAFTIDSIDAHDGFSAAKGHAGSAILPALLAFCDHRNAAGNPISAHEFLSAMTVGYEVSYRAGLALHATTCDYHTSGAWTAVGAAAMGARLLGLSAEQLRHAIGIAEYHGPRSQMMRCIDHPTMLRDGVGWGAPTGVAAVYLAQLGFTGAPAITVEGEEAHSFWHNLGSNWDIAETNYKAYPVCRWAHPAIDAVQDLAAAHDFASTDIEKVTINTFHNATRLAGHEPKTLDEITYAIAFPVATMIVRGKIGIEELAPAILQDSEIGRIAKATELVEKEKYNKLSIRERWGDVCLTLKDGCKLQSAPRRPRGDQLGEALSDAEILEKFHRFATPVCGRQRALAIENAVAAMDQQDSSLDWLDELIYLPLDATSKRQPVAAE